MSRRYAPVGLYFEKKIVGPSFSRTKSSSCIVLFVYLFFKKEDCCPSFRLQDEV
jgi:hypothetical protein